MERGESSSAKKPDRKTVGKNRRILMKCLCTKLVSLVPDHHFNPPKEFLSQQNQLYQAANYIVILRERVDELRRRKIQLMNTGATYYGGLPILEIKELGSELEVVLISGLQKIHAASSHHHTKKKELKCSLLASPPSETRFSTPSILRY